jgi:hypothetical protein
MTKQSSYHTKLGLLKEIKQLTLNRILNWTCTGIDTRYDTEIAQGRIEVEFIRLLRTDQVGSDNIIASIHIFNMTYDYAVGTEGFDLIIEIIALSQPNWQPSWQMGLKRSEANLLKLQNLHPRS